jgi:hypothetical protein
MRRHTARWIGAIVLSVLASSTNAGAEVTKVTIASRAVVAEGAAFGRAGPYEKLTGTIEYALDPRHPRNTRIVDLDHATRGADRRVHFTADLYVLRPVDPQRGNGVMLFEIANRGRKGILGRFNRAGGSQDPMAAADFGDGFLMKEGYTIVWVGWQFDVAAPLLRVEAPAVNVPGRVRLTFIPDQRQSIVTPADLPNYPPANAADPASTLSVRDRFWGESKQEHRSRWRLLPQDGRMRIELDGGFEEGRLYEVTYAATGARVAGVGLAAIRDAASAFRYRTDLPVRGRSAYVFGISQSGRFLRQFLHDGFNADERNRRVFDLVWPHIAGAGQGSFNERFAMPSYSSFPATRFPFTDLEQTGPDGQKDGILAAYRSELMPRVIYTNSSVEYWGQGRAAALTHTTIDGSRDAQVPDNVRIYLLAGTQHGEAAFPPTRGRGTELQNPTPQGNVLRALLRAAHEWVASGKRPPDSRYPELGNQTLVPAPALQFPDLRHPEKSRFLDRSNPRVHIEGPGHVRDGRFSALPFLVPQVDSDGNEIAGIRVPEVVVPLATTTGWNFRSNGFSIYPLLGSYLPFARTKAERETTSVELKLANADGSEIRTASVPRLHDPRPSIEERYRDRDDYLRQIRAAADALVRDRLLLADDVADVVDRASRHWEYAKARERDPFGL